MGDRNQVGIGLLYRPARLRRLAESIPGLLKSLKIPPLAVRNDNPIHTRFLALIDCYKIPAQAPFPFHLHPPSFFSSSAIPSHSLTLFPSLSCSLSFYLHYLPFLILFIPPCSYYSNKDDNNPQQVVQISLPPKNTCLKDFVLIPPYTHWHFSIVHPLHASQHIHAIFKPPRLSFLVFLYASLTH